MQSRTIRTRLTRSTPLRLFAGTLVASSALLLIGTPPALAECGNDAVEAAGDTDLVMTPDGWFVPVGESIHFGMRAHEGVECAENGPRRSNASDDCDEAISSRTTTIQVSEDVQAFAERDANYQLQMVEAAAHDRPDVASSEDVQAFAERDANYKRQMAEAAAQERSHGQAQRRHHQTQPCP